MRALFHLILIQCYGALGILLFDPSAGYGAVANGGSLVVQIVSSGSGLYALYLISGSPRAIALLKQSAPVFILCALAFASAGWSVDWWLTIRRAMLLSISFLIGIAMVGRLGTTGAVRLVVQSMALTCAISVIAVYTNPELAIHQASDAFQKVHAGLWRGVLGHKVELGSFAGLTLALIAYFRGEVFPNLAVAAGAAACAVACLIGSGSATGLTIFATLWVVLAFAHRVALKPRGVRGAALKSFTLGLLLFAVLVHTGTLDTLSSYLGRSSDLTGRATYWPYVQQVVDERSPWLGFGYGAGFRLVGPLAAELSDTRLTEAHNGYYEMLVAFGRLGAPIVFAVIALFFWRARNLLNLDWPRVGKFTVVPCCLLATQFFTCHVESIILEQSGIWTMLFSLSIALTANLKIEHETVMRSILASVMAAHTPPPHPPARLPLAA